MSWIWGKSEPKVSVKLPIDYLDKAVERDDLEFIKAAVENKNNQFTIELFEKIVELDKHEMVKIFIGDYYKRINLVTKNDELLKKAASKRDTKILEALLECDKIMPSFDNNYLYRFYQSKRNREILGLLINHRNFVDTENISKHVEFLKKSLAEEAVKQAKEEVERVEAIKAKEEAERVETIKAKEEAERVETIKAK